MNIHCLHLTAVRNTQAQLERVLGVTAARPAGLAISSQVDTPVLAFPAGGVVVLYNYKRNRQTAFLSAPSALDLYRGFQAASAKRSALFGTKAVACLAYSADGQFLAVGEAGHHPRVIIYQDGIIVSELLGHKYGILGVAFSPDSKYLVSVGYQHDGAVNLWNWRLGHIVATSRTSNKITCVAFDPQGAFFVTAGIRHMKFWYLNMERLSNVTPEKGRSDVMALEGVFASIPDDLAEKPNAFVDVGCLRGADGETATYAITMDGTLMYFNRSRQMEKWVDIKVTAGRALHVTDKYIACGGSDGILRLFDSSLLQYIMTFPKPHPLDVEPHSSLQTKSSAGYPELLSVKIDPLNQHVACIYDDHSLYVWDIRDPKHVGKSHSFLWHSGAVWGVEMVPDQPALSNSYEEHAPRGLPRGTFATCSYDGTVRFWNLDGSGAALGAASQSPVKTQRFFQHNIYSRELLRTMHFGDTEPAVGLQSSSSGRGIRALRVSSDGKYLATGDRVGNVCVSELSWFQEVRSFEAHDGEVLAIDFSEDFDGRNFYMATASRDRCVHVYDGKHEFDVSATLEGHTAAVTCVRFADAGRKLITCGADKSLNFRQIGERGRLDEWSSYHSAIGKHALNDMVLDPASKYLVTASHDRRINIFSIANGKAVRSYRHEGLDESIGTGGGGAGEGSFHKIAIDPSGLYIATSASDKSVRFFDFFSGVFVGRIVTGHSELVTGVKFTLDCRRLVTTAADGCVFVWKIAPRLVKQMRARLGDGEASDTTGGESESATAAATAVRKTSFASSVGAGARAGFQAGEPTTPTTDDDQPLSAGSLRSMGFQYREAALPGWARASASGRSDAGDGEVASQQRFVAPRGRWAQRIGQDELVLFSAGAREGEQNGAMRDDDKNDGSDDDVPDTFSVPQNTSDLKSASAEAVRQDMGASEGSGTQDADLARLLEHSSTDLVIEDLDSLTETSIDGSGSQSGLGDEDDGEPTEQFAIYLPPDAEDLDIISAAHVVRRREEHAGGNSIEEQQGIALSGSGSSLEPAEETSFTDVLAGDDSFLSDLAKVVSDDAAAASPERQSVSSLSAKHSAARATEDVTTKTTLLAFLEVGHAPADERASATTVAKESIIVVSAQAGSHAAAIHPSFEKQVGQDAPDGGSAGQAHAAANHPSVEKEVGQDAPDGGSAGQAHAAANHPSVEKQVGQDAPDGGSAGQAHVATGAMESESHVSQRASEADVCDTTDVERKQVDIDGESASAQLPEHVCKSAQPAPESAASASADRAPEPATGAGFSQAGDLNLELFRALAGRSAQRLVELASEVCDEPSAVVSAERAAVVESLTYVRGVADRALAGDAASHPRFGSADGNNDEASMLRMLERYSDVLVGLVRDKLKGG
ncbi:hypothetical protein HDU86_004700 [Geranomyces michiganensis]|nr:hypothetical protein HDU86_004700 [Geranomyces michiganensis]